MYVKKYLLGYILLSVGVPITLFVCNEVGNELLKGIVSILFIVCAIINFIYSNKIIKYVFGNRGHNRVDLEYVIQTALIVILLYLLRFICLHLLGMEQVPNFLIYFIMSPFVLLIVSPFMKNYCLNQNTLRVSLFISFILMMVVIPFAFKIVDIGLAGKANITVFQSTYNNYFMYEKVSDMWILNITEAFNIKISDSMLLIILNFMSFVIWALTFLPYVVINSIITDELTYMEFCKKLSGLNITAICVTVVALVVLCNVLSTKGEISVLYSLKHY